MNKFLMLIVLSVVLVAGSVMSVSAMDADVYVGKRMNSEFVDQFAGQGNADYQTGLGLTHGFDTKLPLEVSASTKFNGTDTVDLYSAEYQLGAKMDVYGPFYTAVTYTLRDDLETSKANVDETFVKVGAKFNLF